MRFNNKKIVGVQFKPVFCFPNFFLKKKIENNHFKKNIGKILFNKSLDKN